MTKADRRKFLKAALAAMAATAGAGTISCRTAMCYTMGSVGSGDVKPPFTFLLKGNKKVAIVCRHENQSAPQELSRDIARQVSEIIDNRTKNKKLKVVEPSQIEAWLDSNVFNELLEVGRAVTADFVIGIELIGFQLRDSHSPHLLQGKARLQVRACDCKTGEMVADKPLDIVYPPTVPITATGPDVEQPFRVQFIQIISEQIANLFVHHYDPPGAGQGT